jgi:peptidoglycan/LPS O-acetylase OafA/YrhL
VLSRSLRLLAAAPDVAALWRRQPSIGSTYLLLIAWALGMSILLAVGPPSRWSAPGFATIQQTGGPHAWAALWAAGGLALVVGRRLGARWAAQALHLNAVFCLLWAISLALPPLRNDVTSWSGTLTYGFVGLLCVVKADAHRAQVETVALLKEACT